MASATFATASSSMSFNSPKFIGAVEDEWQLYSDRESDYTIGSPIGFGASSIVYAATYQHPVPKPSSALPPPIPCALKVLDLDALPPRSLALLQRETTLMSLSKHPNVLRVRGSWMTGHKLYIALRLMNKGSAADVMRYGWPGGMEEDVVRCILRQALQGLNYLHINGFIHRDIKAANLLIDDDGTVLLGDLGVAADLTEDTSQRISTSKIHRASASTALAQSDSHSTNSSGHSGAPKRVVLFDHTVPMIERPRICKRKSFVGTPCWMAPELIQGRQYDSSADIWSFGITALELTQGRPPRSRETPQRVLLRTIQDDPPTLDREGGTYKYSRAFKEMVDSCLVKDPSKRPTAQDLLQTPFFKAAKKKSYLVGAILKNLPPLTQRQERRIALNSPTLHSLDSWDFAATTLHAGTPGLYQRRVFEDLNLLEEPQAHESVFEMEDDATEGEINEQHISEEISWVNEADNDQEDISEVDPSTSSSSPSDYDFSSGPALAGSSAPSSLMSDASSPPSAISSKTAIEKSATSGSSEIAHKNTLTEKFTMKKSGSQSSSQAPIPSSSPSSSVLSSSLSHLSSSATSHRKGLWHKVKSNVRGARNHFGEDENAQAPHPVAKKEKIGRWRASSLLG
ncbi:hypothetical protein D9615_005129 [Tricholomella constricta]|uniref:Protein kinase domain-containing protein n=1 Tax=Tricholomella constricta TaxID=117010 RepID=A0A8H5H6D0_9AGAR|nr:hypothetical protein D9615_005129 [Tricholomella constricta]